MEKKNIKILLKIFYTLAFYSLRRPADFRFFVFAFFDFFIDFFFIDFFDFFLRDFLQAGLFFWTWLYATAMAWEGDL